MALPLQLSGRHIVSGEPKRSSLKDKNVLITGGASGLCAAVAKTFAESGAYVTIADLNEELGKTYSAELKSKGLKVNFVHTDVTSWTSHTAAFKAAITFAPNQPTIDIVIAGAGIYDAPFLRANDEPASLEKDPPAPSVDAINVNLIGLTYTAKLAQHYFSLPTAFSPIGPPSSKALILVSSSGGYLEFPLAASYNASKWGVRGLFRTIREPLATKRIRVNLIAPWLVETPLTKDDLPAFKAVGLPVGKTEDVVKVITLCAVDESIVGRAFVVGPRKIVDVADDEEGEDGALVMKRYLQSELPGYRVKIGKLMKMLGFTYASDTGDLLQSM